VVSEEHRGGSNNVIVPGMKVEATAGDLGEQDVSPPQVIKVIKGQEGNVQAIEVSKGAFFHKKLTIPADRIQSVNPAASHDEAPGKVAIDITESELEALTAASSETLPPESERAQENLLNQREQQVPTAEGIRENERKAYTTHWQSLLLRVIGPGLLSGTSGNDPSAVTVYAVDGANVGYGHLWLMLLTTPLYQAVQFACAKIGRISQKDLSQLLREHYGRPVAVVASLLLLSSNIALIAADLAAIGSGFELITGLSWVWFVAPVAVALWHLTVYGNFESFKPTFRSFNRRDYRFFHKAALRESGSADGQIAGVRRGRAKLRESVHGATQCPQNIERPTASLGAPWACALDQESSAGSQSGGSGADTWLSDRSVGTAP
jgi:Natural resistance-associated macrophage protein